MYWFANTCTFLFLAGLEDVEEKEEEVDDERENKSK